MDCDCENNEQVAMLKKTIYGNGDPENSVLVRLVNIEKRMRVQQWIGAAILVAVITTFVTNAARWVHVGPPEQASNPLPVIVSK